jgi:hypothetical protein
MLDKPWHNFIFMDILFMIDVWKKKLQSIYTINLLPTIYFRFCYGCSLLLSSCVSIRKGLDRRPPLFDPSVSEEERNWSLLGVADYRHSSSGGSSLRQLSRDPDGGATSAGKTPTAAVARALVTTAAPWRSYSSGAPNAHTVSVPPTLNIQV